MRRITEKYEKIIKEKLANPFQSVQNRGGEGFLGWVLKMFSYLIFF
jgi:hypothetical protein